MAVALATVVATGIGGGVYSSAKSKEQKQEFISNFNHNNMEREKAGLLPLDLCTEKYNFDKGWAEEDPQCASRIRAYEAGDKGALGVPQLTTTTVELGPTPYSTPLPTPSVQPIQSLTQPMMRQ